MCTFFDFIKNKNNQLDQPNQLAIQELVN